MSNTLINLSTKPDLKSLAVIVRAVQSATGALGPRFFLMGAAARDLLLQHAHGIDTSRKTRDVDFAVMVESWDVFQQLRHLLLKSGEFLAAPGPAIHTLRHQVTRLPLDIVPFGGIERSDRTIAWPPNGDEVFDCFGAREALEACREVLLPDGVSVLVPSIPALLLLKISAWCDRKFTHPRRDAVDIALYLVNYLDCGNMDRAAREHADLFAVEDYDHEATSARLLGRDMAVLLDAAAKERILGTLLPEAKADGPRLLVQQSGLAAAHGIRLIGALCQGLSERNKKVNT